MWLAGSRENVLLQASLKTLTEAWLITVLARPVLLRDQTLRSIVFFTLMLCQATLIQSSSLIHHISIQTYTLLKFHIIVNHLYHFQVFLPHSIVMCDIKYSPFSPFYHRRLIKILSRYSSINVRIIFCFCAFVTSLILVVFRGLLIFCAFKNKLLKFFEFYFLIFTLVLQCQFAIICKKIYNI